MVAGSTEGLAYTVAATVLAVDMAAEEYILVEVAMETAYRAVVATVLAVVDRAIVVVHNPAQLVVEANLVLVEAAAFVSPIETAL
jgi:hypothetical protein